MFSNWQNATQACSTSRSAEVTKREKLAGCQPHDLSFSPNVMRGWKRIDSRESALSPPQVCMNIPHMHIHHTHRHMHTHAHTHVKIKGHMVLFICVEASVTVSMNCALIPEPG